MAAAALAQPAVVADKRLIVALDVPTADEARALVAGLATRSASTRWDWSSSPPTAWAWRAS